MAEREKVSEGRRVGRETGAKVVISARFRIVDVPEEDEEVVVEERVVGAVEGAVDTEVATEDRGLCEAPLTVLGDETECVAAPTSVGEGVAEDGESESGLPFGRRRPVRPPPG